MFWCGDVGNITVTKLICIMGRYKNLKWFICFMLVVLACGQNEPDLDYTCDESGMHIQMKFDSPFRGLVYVKGYTKDPNCRLILQVPTQETSFNIPIMTCDMYNPTFPDSSPWMLGILVFQQHPLIPTINDTAEPVACALEGTNVTNWYEVAREALNNINVNPPPSVMAWLEFGLAPSVFSEAIDPSPNDTNFIYFRVYGTRQYSDIVITECIAHDEPFLTPNTSVHQVMEYTGCSNTSEDQSAFNVTKSRRGFINGVYAEFNPLDIENLNTSFITCSAVLCKNECKCAANENIIGYSVIATRKLLPKRYKRSVWEETETSRHYKNRNSLIRSTMKALAERFKKNQRRPRLDKEKTDLERRVMPIEDPTEAMTIYNRIPTDSPFSEQTSKAVTEFTTESDSEVETHISDVNFSTVSISNMFISELELEKIAMVDYTTEFTSKQELTSKDTATVVPELETEKLLDFIDKTTEDILNPKLVNEDLQQNIATSEDIISTLKVTTEVGRPDLTSIGNTNLIDENHEKDDCFPKFKFVLVTVTLSFVIMCVILISCGLVLYIRKEKKKHAIDNFLLYNFY